MGQDHAQGHGWDWGFFVMQADRDGLLPICEAGWSKDRSLLVLKSPDN